VKSDAIFEQITAERRRLADALAPLSSDEWRAPSLCAGWSVHVVAAHLNAPWEVSVPSALWSVVRAGGLEKGFDATARELAQRLDPARCVEGLRTHAADRFTPPFTGPEAPLTDVLVHGLDMLEPLGRSAGAGSEALRTSLSWVASGPGKGFASRRRVADLRIEATDLALETGPGGAVVAGPALALLGALCGRRALLDQLHGDGVLVLRQRVEGAQNQA